MKVVCIVFAIAMCVLLSVSVILSVYKKHKAKKFIQKYEDIVQNLGYLRELKSTKEFMYDEIVEDEIKHYNEEFLGLFK